MKIKIFLFIFFFSVKSSTVAQQQNQHGVTTANLNRKLNDL